MTDLREGLRRARYYASGFMDYLLPGSIMSRFIDSELRKLTPRQKASVEERVAYYVRLPQDCPSTFVGDFEIDRFRFPWNRKERHSAYFLDLYPYLSILPGNLQFNYFAGDTDKEAVCPTLIKSRPVADGATNSAVCRLNSLRHFRFVKDRIPFRQKLDIAVSRNEVRKQPWRSKLLDMYCGHPLTDFGQINSDCGNPEWLRPFMPVTDQLKYKFVMCIRGNDVATNLKWVMSSNSLAVMPRPTVESWYQEGLLQPDVHYMEIKDDYSDLSDRMEWFISHPEDAEYIIHNANQWTERFMNPHIERCAMALAVREYFIQTGQL